MHGGFENETPNIPTNTIMKLDLAALFVKSPNLLIKLEQSTQNKKSPKSVGGPGNSGEGQDGKRTPPMQSLARDVAKIKMDRAEVEIKAGGGTSAMVHKTMQKYTDEKKMGSTGMQ